MLTMCLHPRYEITQQESIRDLKSLEEFDQCDYVYLLNDVDIDDLVVLQLNIRGLYTKLTNLSHLLSNCIVNRKPDVVLLSETWLTPMSPPVCVPGYDFIHRCRQKKKGGGVGILVSKNIRYHECRNISSCVTENEAITIEIELRSKTNCIVSSMYRLPNIDIEIFQSCYNSLLCKMKRRKPKAIVIGLDHNLDFLKAANLSGTERFIQTNLEFNLMPTITRPTRITKSSATLIDNIFVSQTLCGNYFSSILVDDISDHLPSICIIKSLKSVKNKSIQIKSRDTRLRNITALQNHLSKYDWQTLLREKDVSAAMDKFHKVLQYEIDLCIPETTRLLTSKNVRRELWLSVTLKRCIDKSKRLYCKSLKSDCPKIRNHYKEYSSTLKKSIKQAKQLFHQQQCNDFKYNSRKLWQVINKITGHLNDKMSSIDYLTIDGVQEYDGNAVSNSLAKYFSTVGKKFADKIPNSTRNVKEYLSRLQGNTSNLFFEPCTITEVRRTIKNLSAKKE